jgi:GH24 family phage-related lysozyme (muramidase)
MSIIKPLEVHRIKALGLNNTSGIDKSVQKKVLQIKVSKKPKNFSDKIILNVETNLSNSERLYFHVFDVDSILSNTPNSKSDTSIRYFDLSVEQAIKGYTIQLDKKDQEITFKDWEGDSAELYIVAYNDETGHSYSEVFDVLKYDFKNKKPIAKKVNKNLRKFVNELKPSPHFFLSLKEKEGLGDHVVKDAKGNIVRIYAYDDSSDYATIGWGHLIERKPYDPTNPKHAKWKEGITEDQAERLLYDDVMAKTKLLENGLGDSKTKGIKVKLLQREYDGLLMAIFNGGYGETLENTINKGVEKLTKEEIFKAFLTRRFSNGSEERGLIKRRAMEADIFVNDNWAPFPSEKYEDYKAYILAFQGFLKTGILPVFMILFLLLSCDSKKESAKNFNKPEVQNNSKDSISISDSCKASLSRIKKFDDGVGNDEDVIKNFGTEEESWKKEINNIYQKLHDKIKKTDSESLSAFEKYHSDWENYINQKKSFRRSFLTHYIYTKEWIFYIYPQLESEYKNKLIEYYELYEFNENP